jgi:uroporphyrinogen III methyltransferase/synthase
MNGNVQTTAAQPLFGKRIVITRARSQAANLARSIEELGGLVIEFATIEIQPPADIRPLDEAIGNLSRYHWLIFTSANGVERFLARMAHFKRSLNDLKAAQIAAIGPETARRLKSSGVQNCLVPAAYQAEGLLDVLQSETLRGKRILIPRAAKAREILPETLRQWGAEVDVVEAYRTVLPTAETGRLKEMIARRAIHMVTFTSSSTVINFARLFDGERLSEILAGTPIACIGPITKNTIEELGGIVTVLAREFTIPGLVGAMVDYFQTNLSPS